MGSFLLSKWAKSRWQKSCPRLRCRRAGSDRRVATGHDVVEPAVEFCATRNLQSRKQDGERCRIALQPTRRPSPDQLPEHQAEIEGTGVNQQSLEDVGVAP